MFESIAIVLIISVTILIIQDRSNKHFISVHGPSDDAKEIQELKAELQHFKEIYKNRNSSDSVWSKHVNKELDDLADYKKKVDALAAKAGFGL